MLAGLQNTKVTYDSAGNLLESMTTTWQACNEVGSDPSDPDGSPVRLRGGWVYQDSVSRYQDGVTTTTEKSYVSAGCKYPVSAQAISSTFYSNDGANNAQNVITTNTLGAALTPALRAIHALKEVGQAVDSTELLGATTTTGALTHTFDTWETSFDDAVMAPAQSGEYHLRDTDSTVFDYTAAATGTVPSGWIAATRTTARTLFGQASEQLSPRGIATSKYYDQNSEMSLAEIINAPLGSAVATAFDGNSDLSDWTLTGTSFDTDDTFTGTQSLKLPGSQNASASVQVTRDSGIPYIITLRYKTGSASDLDTAPTLSYTFTPTGGSVVTGTSHLDPSTDWVYMSVPIASDNNDQIVIEATVTNAGSDDLWVDQMMIVPLEASVKLNCVALGPQIITSTTDIGGRTSRTLYDGAFRSFGNVGSNNQLREVAGRGLSRRTSRDGSFDPTVPNAELTLRAAGATKWESFRDGGAWAERWVPADASAWSTSDGWLTRTGTGDASLTYSESFGTGASGLVFRLWPGDTPSVNITMGNITLSYDTTNGYLAQVDGPYLTAHAQPPQIARQWKLIFGGGAFLFFADGQLIFSAACSFSGTEITMTLDDGSKIQHLGVMSDIAVSQNYLDGAARMRQAKSLNGSTSIVAGTVYDGLGRQVATAKAIPGEFGGGGRQPLMAYAPSYVDVSAFLTATKSDWKMTGDVADYYTSSPKFWVTDDGGYPYVGNRFEASPRKRLIEVSKPGPNYAIDLTKTAAQRATLQMAFGANTGSEDPSLTSGQYNMTTVTNSAKLVAQTLTDKSGQVVGSAFNSDSGSMTSATTGTRTYSNDSAVGPRATMVQQLPNAAMTQNQNTAASFVRTTVADALNQAVSLTDPSTGETQFILDDAGNLRFTRPAQTDTTPWFVYYTYDALGRIIEQGTSTATWDTAALQAIANASDAPSDATPQISYSYSGDGSMPTLLGNKYQTTTLNPAPTGDNGTGDVTVTETFGYTECGSISYVDQTATGTEGGLICYDYDTLGRVTQIIPPSGSTVSKIYYTRDALGCITHIGSTQGGSEFARYEYTAGGNIKNEYLNNEAWVRSYTYHPDGAPDTVSTQSQADGDTIAIDMSYGFAADGVMTSRDVTYTNAAVGSDISNTYGYDGQRQLKQASGSVDATYASYDASGNLLEAIEDAATSLFTRASDSDRITQSQIAGAAAEPMSWSARGQLLSGFGRSFEYDEVTLQTTSVSMGGNSTRLAYGAQQQRVLKSGPNGTIAYLHGTGLTPIARDVGGVREVNIMGPEGILAVVSDKARFPLTDLQGCVWAVVDDSDVVASYDYSPFGRTVSSAGVDADSFPYRWQCRELDNETGLYDFRARLYDPQFMRFHAPDPKRQYASPYIFCGNSPLVHVDPTGEMSVWAQVGLGAGALLLAGVGIAVIAGSGGAATGIVAAAEGFLVGTEVAGEAGALGAGAVEGGIIAGDAAGAGAAAEGGASAAAEVSTGARIAQQAAMIARTAATYAPKVARVTIQTGLRVAGSSISGAGTNGAWYDAFHWRSFSSSEMLLAMGAGAAAGAASGVVGAGLDPFVGLSGRWGGRLAIAALNGSISGATFNEVSNTITNLAHHDPAFKGMAFAALRGAASGAALGAAGQALKDWDSIAASVKSSAAKEGEAYQVNSANKEEATNGVSRLLKAAKNQENYVVYGSAATLALAGYSAWGLYEFDKSLKR